MALAQHVDAEKIINESRDHPVRKHTHDRKATLYDIPYTSRYDVEVDLPRYSIPETGVNAKVSYQLLHDELLLDGNPNMNLASFVNTWVPDECNRLMYENLNKNLVDQDEYPAAQAIHERCISMISHLWHAPKDATALGTATTGSSEAIMLGGMALKKRWQEKMKAAGKDIHNPGPNIVMGAEAQVALEKFARYFEVEAKLVPVHEKSGYVMDPKEAIKYCDENTIGIFVIMGSTYTGTFESVQGMSDELDKYQEETGIDIPIHVDAASGGFVAPFVYPQLAWDFRIPRVNSINASGHKYGLASVGLGWIIWRSAEYLPKELIFELHYLGQTDYSFNLNFSRPAFPVLSQMFHFLNLGFSGYKRINENNLSKARLISRALEASGYFVCLSQIHRAKNQGASNISPVITKAASDIIHGHVPEIDDPTYYVEGLPVVSFRFSDEIKEKYPRVKQEWIQSQLRAIGWIVPNYPLPPAEEDTEILRCVVRESLSGDLARKLILDIIQVTEGLLNGAGPSYHMSIANRRQSTTSPVDVKRGGTLDTQHISEHTSTYAKTC
ncbi:glutamate decarboxylase [Kwoniella mangroviensis CBS 10435]|uniref:Glutamate decarboxylase n=1 Tax=Kwoniella mangroviensis CBS 10435 TaxID=1331196 RepID=A0A1B9IWK9_9TREE|nr:glutamate decarboxylase [Kwoniella mangroviensis CBS 8507]OCF59915.1 glutamate decarboxylase [Kwoniella mangroviensis CBS 10435]OCF69710.1 glutamate decarboxylase [Kwoniella mangroviensis CBS 8507]OCF71439.1 glutamate decarboxylase [Kwoniella mangroviensis CBS 8886]